MIITAHIWHMKVNPWILMVMGIFKLVKRTAKELEGYAVLSFMIMYKLTKPSTCTLWD